MDKQQIQEIPIGGYVLLNFMQRILSEEEEIPKFYADKRIGVSYFPFERLIHSCSVTNSLSDAFHNHGYYSYRDILSEEAKDPSSYMSDVPSEVLQEITKYLTYREKPTLCEAVGYTKVNEVPPVTVPLLISFTPEYSQAKIGLSKSLTLELLFRPSIYGLTCLSLPEAIVNQAKKTKESHHLIALNGGLFACDGIIARLEKEVNVLHPRQTWEWITEGGNLAWKGASMKAHESLCK